MLTNEQYAEIKASLNFKRSLFYSLGFIIADGFVLYCAIRMLQAGGFWSYWLAEVLLALVFLHQFILLHECGHNTVAKRPWINPMIGHLNSIFCCMPFYTWKIIHEEHHRWTGHIDKDPVFALLKTAKEKKKLPWIFHLGWRSFIPFNVLFLHIVYWTYPFKLFKHRQLKKTIFLQCAGSLVFLLFSYLLLKGCFSELICVKNLLPAIILYGIFWELLSTPQHLGLKPTAKKPSLKEHAITTRSTWFPWFIQRFLLLNFGYHVEHHFFPALPWHELEKAHVQLKPLLKDEYNMVTGGIWNLHMRSVNMEKAIGVLDD